MVLISISTSALRLLALRGLRTLRIRTWVFGPRVKIKFGFSVPDYPISPLKPRFWGNFQLTFNSAYPNSGQTNEQTDRQTENNCNLVI